MIIHKVQHRKQFQRLLLRRTSILFVNDVILYSLRNIKTYLRKFFFSFYYHLTCNCKRTLKFLAVTRGLFTLNRSLWEHHIGIPSFYYIILYSPSRWVFLVQTNFVFLFLEQVLSRCFFDGFEQNKMIKGVTICLHRYVSFNPFVPNAPFSTPQETSENRKVSDVYRG